MSPSEEGVPTCPECGSESLVQTGPYRMHCAGCNGLFKNEECHPKPEEIEDPS